MNKWIAWIFLICLQLNAQESEIVLKSGQYKVLSLENVKSVRVGNPQIVEVKKNKDDQELWVYPIKSGRTEVIIKYKDNKPPLLIVFVVEGEELIKPVSELKIAFEEEHDLSILPVKGHVILQGQLQQLKFHDLAQRLVKEGVVVASYQFGEKLCQSIALNIKQYLQTSQWGDFQVKVFGQCDIKISGMSWQSKRLIDYINHLRELYASGLSIDVHVAESDQWPLVIKTEIEVVEHRKADQDQLGITYAEKVPIRSASSDILSAISPTAQATVKKDDARVVLKPIIYTQNGQTASFESSFDMKDQGQVGIRLSLLPKLLDEKRIITEVEVLSLSGLQKNSVKTVLLGKSGETFLLSGFNQTGLHQQTQGIWLLSDIPVLGYLFKFRQKNNTDVELSILIKQSIVKTNP